MFVNLQAQKNKTLPKFIVSPNAMELHQAQTGRSITVITARDIQTMGAISVEDVLQSVEGINMNARGGFGVQTDLGMRGSTFSQVLVLLDNVRVNEALTGHYNMYLPIALSEIERIEIVRGPAASAYGADAVGGLVHIQTKNYRIKKARENKEISSKGNVQLGENKLRLIDALVDSKNEHVYIGGSVNVKSSIGQFFDNPNVQRDSLLNASYRTNFDIRNYSLFGSYFLNKKTKLYARTSLNIRDFNAKYFYTNSLYDESVEKVNTIWSQIGLQHHAEKSSSQLGLAYKQLSDEFIFNPLFSKNNHTTKTIIAFAQQQRRFSNRLKGAYGLQSIFQQITSTDRGNHKNSTHALFASLSYDLGAKTTLNASGRVENNANYGFSFAPQLGFAYQATKSVVIRSSIGKSHRSPDFTERYIANNLPSLSAGRNLGNPNLKTESSYTADIGIDYFTKEEKLFSLSVFAREGTNLVDYILTNSSVIPTEVQLAPNSNYFYTQNISNAFTYGLEAGVQKRIQVSSKSNLRLQANYTYVQTETENDEPSKYISNHPGHMANVSLSLQTQYLDVMWQNNFRHRKPEINEAVFGAIPESYLLSNAVIRLKMFKNQLGITAKVLNLFDNQYQEILGSPMPRRWFMAGIDWKL